MKRASSKEGFGPGVVDLIDRLLDRAVQARASDVHFEPMDGRLSVRFRVDGLLHEVETLPTALQPNVLTRLKVMAGLLSYRSDIPQEGGLTLDSGGRIDARVSTFPTIRGERAAVRLLAAGGGLRALADLGLSDAAVTRLRAAGEALQGLLAVTGPAGSGKSTTLHALLRHLHDTRPGMSMITLEDPVELRLDGVPQIQIAPHGELTYARALRSILRQDPQVVLLGEIRDAETAGIAIEAALTGHLILSTLHGGRAAGALVRLLDMGIAPYQLTSTLNLVLCQRLVRTVCPQCGARADARDACEACLGSGYRGRTACAEFIEMSDALRQAILAHADARELSQAAESNASFVPLEADAARHVASGRTTPDEIAALA